MRTALKMVLPLIVSVAVVSGLFAWYQVRTERRILRSDLSRRAEISGEALQESVEPLLDRAPSKNLQRLVERFGERARPAEVPADDFVIRARGEEITIVVAEADVQRGPGVPTHRANAPLARSEIPNDDGTVKAGRCQ